MDLDEEIDKESEQEEQHDSMEEDAIELNFQDLIAIHGEQAIAQILREELKKLQKNLLKRTCKFPITSHRKFLQG